MTAPDLETEIFVSLHQLPVEQQRHVLEFVRAFGTARVQGGARTGVAVLRWYDRHQRPGDHDPGD
jgi:hypothetical protein